MARAAGQGVRAIEILTAQALEARATRSEHDGVAWRSWGASPPGVAPLVLLHGGAGSWSHWVRNIDALCAGRTVWIPDLPGLGDSALPPAPRDHEAVARMLAPCIDRLMPRGEFDLVGFSFGGIVAAFLAALRPGRVRSLVLVGAGGLGLRKGQASILLTWRHLPEGSEREAAQRHNLGALMFSTPARIDPLALALYTKDLPRTRINSARSSKADPLLPLLGTLGVPIHGIWGRHDVTARGKFEEIGTILRDAYPAAQLHIVEHAGHWVQYEQAAAFNRVLLDLLETPQ